MNDLKQKRPELSAGVPVRGWQIGFVIGFAVLAAASWIVSPQLTGTAILAGLSLSFFGLALLRLFSIWRGPPPLDTGIDATQSDVSVDASDSLPDYSVLVPLFREAGIARDLVSALEALDYPRAKLQVILILEEADHATRRALERIQLPDNFEIAVVPSGSPQTKPRALNYALQQARGTFVTVYDAEDVPDPGQLRLAIAAFRTGPPHLACVQARLSIYNTASSWLTRQFAIEYSVLFDWLLPALQALGLPVPLGGTSNHFRKADLVAIGGWDPFNVTEDADLGIRFARAGRVVQVLHSTTWEEAPHRLGAWRRQRTRWLKGWMQTYLVHTRQPLRLWRDLGAWRFCGLHLLMGGLIVSALVHPWFYGLAALSAWRGTLLQLPSSLDGQILWALGLFNLVFGYVTGVWLGMVAASHRQQPWLGLYALLMPVYWLLISFAAYWALFQFVWAPYFWEKTEHVARSHGLESPHSGSG